MRTRAFTLVELLVVIAVLGCLMGLLLPAIQAAREAARSAQCLSNLHQLGVYYETHYSIHGTIPNIDDDFEAFGGVAKCSLLESAPGYAQFQGASKREAIMEFYDRPSCDIVIVSDLAPLHWDGFNGLYLDWHAKRVPVEDAFWD